jgi:hypothetical protein
MKDNKALFIKTTDAETSKALQAEGFQLVDSANGIWTFINDIEKPLMFDNKKMAYSNKLCF